MLRPPLNPLYAEVAAGRPRDLATVFFPPTRPSCAHPRRNVSEGHSPLASYSAQQSVAST